MSTDARPALLRPAGLRGALLCSCAGAALALLPLSVRPAAAQGFQGVPTFVAGNGSVAETATTTTVTIDEVETIIDWAPFDTVGPGNVDFLPAGHLGEFQNGPNIGDYVVLNRVLPTDPGRAIEFNGLVTSRLLTLGVPGPGGAVWFYSPGGIVVGADAVFDVGSLLLTANAATIDSGSFIDAAGSFTLTATAGSIASVINNGSLTAGAQNGYLVMVAPRVQQSGTASVEGAAGFVAAEAVQMRINGGLFDIAMTAGTSATGDVIVHDGTTNLLNSGLAAPGPRNAFLATVSKNDAVTMLLSGSVNYQPAAGAEVVDNKIVLAAGYNVLGGTANSQIGLPQRANIAITGENFDPSVIGTATGSATVTAAAPMNFGGDLLLTAPGGATATALAGGAIEIGGDLLLDANGNQTDPQGNAALIAAAGSTIDVAGDALVTADLAGTGGIDVVSTRSAAIRSDGGAIDIVGSATVSADAFGGNGTIPPGGAATAGTASIATTAAAGSINVGGTTDVTARARGGTSFVDGGAGTGGQARIAGVAGSNMALTGAVTVDASGVGANGEGAGGTGGAGRGGTAEYALGNATNLASLTVQADGTGGAPGGGGMTGANGGNGSGGSASVRLGPGANALADLSVLARGNGGAAPARTGSPPGTGGAGTGGAATLLSGGGTVTITVATVDASGEGGVGGIGVDDAVLSTGPVAGGTGGGGTGGTVLVASAAGGTLTIVDSAFTAFGTGGVGGAGSELGFGPTGGAGGTGGAGTGGVILVETRGGALAFTGSDGLGISPIGSGGAGGAGGFGDSTGPGGAGGNGGIGRGGTGALDVAGGSATPSIFGINAAGVGGAAGAGGVDAFGGQAPEGLGGDGYGGLARLSVADGPTGPGSANLGDVSLAASGFGVGSAASFAGTVRLLESAAAPGGSIAMASLNVEAGGDSPAAGHVGFELTTAAGPIAIAGPALVTVAGSASLSGAGTGSLTAGGNVDVTAVEAITLAQNAAPAGAPLIAGANVTLTAGTTIAGASAAIDAAADATLTAPGAVSIGGIVAGDDIDIAAGAAATAGLLRTTGAADPVGGEANVVVHGTRGVTVATIDAAGAADLRATGGDVLVSQDLGAAGPVDALGINVRLVALGTLPLASATATNGSVDVSAGFLDVSGPVRGSTIIFASQDIAIGTNASVGTLNETQTLSITANLFGGGDGGGAPIAFIGGTPADGNGYRLDNQEFSRLAARDIRIAAFAPEVGGDMVVGTLSALGPGVAGANLGRRLTLLAGGEIDIFGEVTIDGAADASAIAIRAGGDLYVDPAAGGVKVHAAGGALAGTVALEGASVVVASEQAVADLAALPTIGERNQRLGTNDGEVDPAGPIQAAGVTLTGSDSILVQNSGTNALVPGTFNPPDNRAGITVGAAGLSLVTLGPDVEIIVNGRQEDGAGGFFTGTALIPRTTLAGPQGAASFAAGSTINGCPIIGACLRPDLIDVPGDRDIIDEFPPRGDILLPGLRLDRLIGAEGSSALDIIDEPVTGAGNDDLWIFFDEEEEEEEEAPPAAGDG